MRTQLTAALIASLSLAVAQTPAPDLLRDVNGRSRMTLEDFKQLALAGNPTLRQAEAIVQQSAGQARQAGLYPNPSAGYQGEEIRGGSYRGGKQGAFVQGTIVLGGKLGLRRNVYELQRQEDQTGVSEQRYRVLSDVSRSFYSALAAQRIVEVQARLLGLTRDAAATAHQLANVGQADAPDVLQAEVEAEQAQVDYTTAQSNYLQEFRMLSALAGKPDLPVSPLGGDLEHPPALDVQQISEQIVRDSPAVKHAQQDVLRAEAAVKSARREPVPDLQIHAGLQNNFEPLDAAPNNEVGVHAFVTAGLNLPLFNRNQGNIAAANADVARAKAEVRRIQLSLRQSTPPLLQAYVSQQFQALRYKDEMLPRADRAYRLYLEKYQSMAAAYPQVLVSQRTLFQLEIAYIHTLENLWNTSVSLQNYTLSDGLAAPMPAATSTYSNNLPNSSASGAQ